MMVTRPILLVEDNPDDVELTIRAFKRSNILNDLHVATDGQQAIDYLFGTDAAGHRNPLPAVVLLDLKLPKVSGFEILERLRQEETTSRIPVIILTSSREDQDVTTGYEHGANSYIRKPVEFEQFVKVVQQIGMYWLVLNEPVPDRI